MTARKFDANKPQLDLIPAEALIQLGRVLSFGATKYDRGNWVKGLKVSRLYSAALRHMLAWNDGEDIDQESGLPHLAHAMCNISFMLWTLKNRPDMDDRWVRELLYDQANDIAGPLSKPSDASGVAVGAAPKD